MAGLTALDLGILVFVGIGVWRGARTGALRQLVGIVGLVVGIIAGIALMEPVGAIVVGSLGLSSRLAPVLGFATIVLLVVGLAAIVAQLVRKGLDFLRLGMLDRIAGAGVGGLRAALLLSVLLLITNITLPGGQPILLDRDTRRASVLYEPVAVLAPGAWGIVRAVLPRVGDPLRHAFDSEPDE